MRKTTVRRYFTRPYRLSVAASRTLCIGLPIIAAELAAYLYLLWRDVARDATYALHRYPPMLSYIMMGLTALVIGAFLFDYIARETAHTDA